MLVVLAERLAQILEWLKTMAGYRIIESNWKVLDLSNNQQLSMRQVGHRRASSLPTTDVLIPHLASWMTSSDKVSFVWLTNFSPSAKEELSRSLVAIKGQDVFVMGISYSDAQLMSATCRNNLPNGCQTLPRCKSYRLRKVCPTPDPRDSLISSIAEQTGHRRTLYFSRHGESEYNVLGKVGGDADLSMRGFQYADVLAEYVNHTIAQTPGFRLWTSCLKRTIQTARGIPVPQERVEALNELDTGVCDGMTYEEIAERFPAEFAARDDDKFLYRYPEGESYRDLLERVGPVIERLRVENNVMIIAHQAVLRCLLAALLHKDNNELPYINAPLHTIMQLTFTGDECKLDLIPLNVECVDTHRKKPENCSRTRSIEDAIITVPAHF